MSPKVLKTDPPFKIHYCKYGQGKDEKDGKPKMIDLDSLEKTTDTSFIQAYSKDISYNPFCISKLQLYNPVYGIFFELKPENCDKIALNHTYHMKNMTTVVDAQNNACEKPVFIKYSPLLDPVRYMTGKYESENQKLTNLPTLLSKDSLTHSKLLSHNNTSYVDCFFSYLTSRMLHHHSFLHGIDFFGSYLGIQDHFKLCITDDVDYLRNSDFFNENIGKRFYVEMGDSEGDESNDFSQIAGSRGNKRKLVISEKSNISLSLFETIDLSQDEIEDVTGNDIILEPVYENNKSGSFDEDHDGSDSSSEPNYTSEESDTSDSNEKWETDDEDEDEDEDEDDEDDEMYGYIRNFPIQMICLEKCEGTLDELFVKKRIDEKTGASALFQVIMTLLLFQKTFRFTHNDLHTNNIMWVKTEIEFLTYRYAGKTYRVPTYGKIFKLIDFGRAIYKFQDKQFCSDSFGPGGDAVTQYNMEPFLNNNKPRLDPNYSFDLCRLGSSIFDFLMDEELPVSKMNELQKTIHRWCLDDNEKNVLYKKNGEERYPNFKLYKMIARTVHKHTPELQLEFPFFKQFLTKKVCENVMMDLDKIPEYF